MKNELAKEPRAAVRITLMAHQGLNSRVIELFSSLGIHSMAVESARCVRQMMKNRFWGLPGLRAEFSDTATDIFRTTIPSEAAEYVLCKIIEDLGLRTPGRGAVYAQNLHEISCREFPEIAVGKVNADMLLSDLSLITGIQSKSGSGENLFRVALKLGAGVPVVGIGIGSGIRDRLGLLRITISPEKELVYLMVPSHDADGLQSLLIEEGHLNRPGGGFLYQAPVRAGMVDPLIRIGRQEHAASIEQIIAAIDDLKKNTAWRKRFFGLESGAQNLATADFSHREISFFCHDGQGDNFVRAAMRAGAGGATVSRVRALHLKSEEKERSVPCEHGIFCISAAIEKQVMQTLRETAEASPDQEWILQSMAAASVFAHKRS
jgi:hypothetical protein